MAYTKASLRERLKNQIMGENVAGDIVCATGLSVAPGCRAVWTCRQ